MTTNTHTAHPLPGDMLDCGHVLAERTGLGTGYATTTDGRHICYADADASELAMLADLTTSKMVGYLGSNGAAITTWTGGVLMRVTQLGSSRAGFYGSEIHHVRAVDANGAHWYGKNGGPGMAIVMRRAVSK